MGSEVHYAHPASMGWVHSMPGAMQPVMPAMAMHMPNLLTPQQQPPTMCQQHVGRRQPGMSVQGQVLDPHEVTAAVESLYADELKPYGRILRKRLSERAANNGHSSVDVDIKRLRSVCEACSWIYVQVEEGGDWSALLHGRHMNFVDVYSPQDFYPEQLWREAAVYFESLDDANMVLPGGRYSCAQALVSRGLQFLNGRTLGQVSHIVQLAISQKKLLGYLNGAVVPYGRSQSMVKERCAERQKPCTNTARGTGSDLADWGVVKNGLREILSNLGPGTNTIPLSNVKRLFRSRFQIELSETALGHAKLSELLQDPQLHDVCSVRLQGHGYVVSPVQARPIQQLQQPQPQPQLQMQQPQQQPMQPPMQRQQQPPSIQPAPMSAAAAGAAMVAAAAAAACGQPPPPQAAHLMNGSFQVQFAQNAASTGIKELPFYDPATARPHAAEGSSILREVPSPAPAAHQVQTGASLRDRARFVEPLVMEDVETTQCPSRAEGTGGNFMLLSDGMPLMTPTPSASHRRSRSVPKCLGSDKNDWEATCQAMGMSALPATPENLSLMPATPDTPGFPRWPMLTPNTLDNMGFSVQNTFINFALPPPTPLAGSTARSMSLPRNMGASESDEAKVAEKDEDTKVLPSAGSRRPAGNRLMSAAAAAASGGSQVCTVVRPAHTPRGGLKARAALAATAVTSGTPNGDNCSVHSSASAGSGQRVVRLADLL
eukprot:TRINITY_DN1199_c0_g2_i1.p1 TRINITY_DN1199_c0_g2~~TRINITY_DN1199_c0_g2_i1.p1  ORF type:complete len:715 (-),score=119.42 TRINITY_DN1199_c0_g2_i1:108-2252(-)